MTATNRAPAAWASSPDLGHRLQEAEEVGLRGDHAGDRPVRVGEHPGERLEVGRPRGRPVRDQGDLVELEAAAEVRPQRAAVVRMDAAADEDPLAASRPAGHQRRLGRGRRAVVVRGRDHVEVDQLGHQRLVLVDALERALADLGLVRRVGRVPLAAQQQLVDGGRAPMAVDARAQKRHEVGPVPPGEGGQPCGELELGLGRRQVEPRGTQGLGDVGEELVDRGEADGLEHPRPIGAGMGTVGHLGRQPAAISAS